MSDSDSGGGSGEVGDDTVGVDDVARLDSMAVQRAGAIARLAGIVLIVVGVLGAAGWLWITVRQQQLIDDPEGGRFSFGGDDPSLVDRIDALVDYILFLPFSALSFGAGFGLRLAADYTAVRSGGSLSSIAVGDPVPDGGLSHAPETLEVDPFKPS